MELLEREFVYTCYTPLMMSTPSNWSWNHPSILEDRGHVVEATVEGFRRQIYFMSSKDKNLLSTEFSKAILALSTTKSIRRMRKGNHVVGPGIILGCRKNFLSTRETPFEVFDNEVITELTSQRAEWCAEHCKGWFGQAGHFDNNDGQVLLTLFELITDATYYKLKFG